MRVLVTRPAHQAERFIAGLSALGVEAVRLPTIIIELENSLDSAATQATLTSDVIIFTSSNAVDGAVKLLPLNALRGTRQFKIASVGTATTKALQKHFITADIAPAKNGGSEQLLELLYPQTPAGCRVTIVRGDSGRDTLRENLQKNGVKVNYLPVYRRLLPGNEPSTVRRVLENQKPDVICVTSNAGLENLLSLAPPDTHQGLLSLTLIVNSRRCHQLANRLGFHSHILVANPPGDAGQLALIKQIISP